MTQNSKRTLAVLVLIFIVFSVLSFALPFKMNGLFWISYLFGVLSIAVQVYVLKIAFSGADSVKSKFYGFPIARVGIVYMAVQLVLSLVFMALAGITPIWPAVVLYVLALAIGAIGFIGSDVMREEVNRQDEKLKADTSRMTSLYSVASSLVGKSDDADVKKVLSELADEFRYSDPVSVEALTVVEAELGTALAKLQGSVSSGNREQIKNECKKVSAMLAERNRLCKMNKHR